jgi:transaldolase
MIRLAASLTRPRPAPRRELIAPDAINTMPEATLRAFADHGDPTRAARGTGADILQRARRAGIDLDEVTEQLEREGVRSFCASYRELLDCIESKLQRTTVTTAG